MGKRALVAVLVAVVALGCTTDARTSPEPSVSPSTVPLATTEPVPSASPTPIDSAPPSPVPTPIPTPGPPWAGRTWTRHEVTNVDGQGILQLFAPTAANGRFLAVVDGEQNQGAYRLVYSDDGRTWHFARVPGSTFPQWIRPISYGDGRWLAMVFQEARPELAFRALTSRDGRTWDVVHRAPLPPTRRALGRIGGGSLAARPRLASRRVVPDRPAQAQDRDAVPIGDRVDWSVVSTLSAEAYRAGSIESDGDTLVVAQVTGDDGPAAWTSADGVIGTATDSRPRAPSRSSGTSRPRAAAGSRSVGTAARQPGGRPMG